MMEVERMHITTGHTDMMKVERMHITTGQKECNSMLTTWELVACATHTSLQGNSALRLIALAS